MKRIQHARTILVEASEGLDMDKPEYYVRQEFVVIPAKYFERVCDLLLEEIDGVPDED